MAEDLAEEKQEEVVDKYRPDDTEKSDIDFVYNEVDDMMDERVATWRQFNDRTLIGFIDDSEKRVQGYVPSKEAQGKEDWQSNVFTQATRNKTKAVVAAVAMQPPVTHIKCSSVLDQSLSVIRGEYMEHLVQHANAQNNPEVSIFWEAWQAAVQGTVVKYIGYLKTVQKRKFIKSYDLETGEMEFDEKDVVVDDQICDTFVNLNEFYIKNFEIHDVQEQPAVAWIRYVDAATVEMEFGKYKNWKYVAAKNSKSKFEMNAQSQTFFLDRVDEDEYEVIKYYNKAKDMYCVIINGVMILKSPLLWGRAKKCYPFAKQIFEPFSGREFFYGNSLPNANMDVQDVMNSLYNGGLDKNYRAMNPPLLVGTKNKDLLEMENESLGMENTMYVDDVTQIKYQDIPGISNSDLAMIKWVGQQMDLGTVDVNQQGVATRGVTAREIVIANENAKKIKGIFFTFLTDLWIQKTKLTTINILMHYPLPKIEKIVGTDGAETIKEQYKTYYIKNSQFPNGQKGTLAIQFVDDEKNMPSRNELDVQEEMHRQQGVNYRQTAMVSTFFDGYEYEPEVVSDSLYQQSMAQDQAVFNDKLKTMMLAFPEIYQQNKKVLFDEFVKVYRDTAEKYNTEPPAPPTADLAGMMNGGNSGGEQPPMKPEMPSGSSPAPEEQMVEGGIPKG